MFRRVVASVCETFCVVIVRLGKTLRKVLGFLRLGVMHARLKAEPSPREAFMVLAEGGGEGDRKSVV